MNENETKAAENNEQTNETGSLEALKAELERLKSENGKLKAAQSNASADASKYKKQLQERMTEQERIETQTKELIEQLKAENAQMKRDQGVAVRTASYIGVGFDADLAKQAAEASLDNNHEGFMEALKSFLNAHDKALAADALRNTPRPGAGASAPSITKEQFAKMNYTERLKIFNEQPELYNELNK